MNSSQARWGVLVFFCTIALGVTSPAETPSPKKVTLRELSANPRAFDGKLVQVEGWIVFGWEGDNFLLEKPKSKSDLMNPSQHYPQLWFHGDEAAVRKAFETYKAATYTAASGSENEIATGTLTGYFHFVPIIKSRMKDVFDPGPFQLDVTEASSLRVLSIP